MSDELQSPAGDGPVFKPLDSARTEQVRVGGIGESAAPEKTFEGLKAASISTHSAGPDDATPLVVVDDEEQGDADGDYGKTTGELVGELRSLRSRNQILRTERTSIAGRKYALEVVIETLREKLEAVGELCEALDAPGELGEALREIKLVLGDARRIADSKAVLEADLEAERARHLEERQAWEQKAFETGQQLAGVTSERDALKARVARVERERHELQQALEEERKNQEGAERQALEQLEATAAQLAELEERLAAAEERAGEAEAERERLQASHEETVEALEEAVQRAEEATTRAEAAEGLLGELDALRLRAQEAEGKLSELDALRARAEEAEGQLAEIQGELDAARARADAATARAETAESRRAELEAKQGELEARLAKLEARAGKQKATIDEQRKALLEMKPILEDWTQLEKECNRLARLVGEARSRGRVNVQELMARAALLKRLERLTAEDPDAP